jgi:hypothetical protein
MADGRPLHELCLAILCRVPQQLYVFPMCAAGCADAHNRGSHGHRDAPYFVHVNPVCAHCLRPASGVLGPCTVSVCLLGENYHSPAF